MQKKRKSAYSRARASYLSADGRYYCYEYWDGDAGRMRTQRLEVGKDLSEEWTIFLDESDREIGLNDRYEAEKRDPLFNWQAERYQRGDPDAADPWDLAASSPGPEDVLFKEPDQASPLAEKARRFVEDECREAQKDFFFAHYGEEKTLAQMRREESERKGRPVAASTLVRRNKRLIEAVARELGAEPPAPRGRG